MHMNRKLFTGILWLAGLVVPFFLPLHILLQFGLFIAVLTILLYTYRGYYFFIKGSNSYKKGDFLQACRYVEHAVRAGVNLRSRCTAFLVVLKRGDLQTALHILNLCERKAAAESEKQLVRSYQALAIWQQGERTDAIDVLEQLLAEDFRTTQIYSALGIFLLETGNLERALEVCLEAVDYDTTADTLDNLCAAYIAIEDWQSAEEVCGKLLAASPAFPEAWYHAAIVHTQVGDYTTARNYFEKALTFVFSNFSQISRDSVLAALEKLPAAF